MGKPLLYEILEKPATSCVIALCTAAWLYIQKKNIGYSHVGLSYETAVEGHHWRIITSAFSHISVVHLVFNMSALWSLGAVEQLGHMGLGVAYYLHYSLVLVVLSGLLVLGSYHVLINRFKIEYFRRVTAVGYSCVVFEVDDRETIGGSAYGGQRAICCTADLAKLGACKEGEVIHRLSTTNPGWPEVFGVSFVVNEETSTMQPRSVQITRTGMYNLYFMHCEPKLVDLAVEGKTIWKNPNGYLPGRMAPLLNFYGFMSLAFLVLGIFWFSQYARFWKEVLHLQNCITLVITLGMFEMALWYFDYAEFNETGVRPTGITIWAVTFGTIKRTVSRLIILTVSMGYGVVRPTLGGLTSKVVMLGGTFFLASEVLELVEHVGAVSDLSGKAMLFLSLPVAVLDAFFVLWIFTSLSSTLNKLQAKRMMAKLDIYRKFTNALAVAVIVSVGWICYELYFKSTDIYNEQWQNAWIIPAFWHVLSFSLLCVICALWAPSQNSMRYAYSDDGSEEFDKEDTLTLIKPSPVSVSTKDVPELRSEDVDLEEDKTE